jgi:hypothetical protein
VFTDGDGHYGFDGLAPGSYQLTAWPPPRSFLNRTARDGLSVVAAGAETSGQDIVMSGPLRRPRTAFMAGPGFHGDVNDVPVIVRNQPIFWGFDIRIEENRELVEPPVVVGFNTDDPEKVERFFGFSCRPVVNDLTQCELDGVTQPCDPVAGAIAQCALGAITLDAPFLILELARMNQKTALIPDPPRDGDGAGGGTGDGCPPGTVPPNCDIIDGPINRCPPKCIPPPDTQRWGLWWNVDQLQRGRSRGWTVCVYYRTRRFDGQFISTESSRVCYTVWIDPSGFVRSTKGVGIPGTKVVLLRSDARTGPFDPVANGSARMSPANRRNPDRTDSTGHFGWDVVSGYYKVHASKRGCSAPRNKRRKTVETSVYEIPPPVTDINMRMRCPPAPAATRRPALKGKARVGRPLTCSKGRWRNKPRRFSYAWRVGRGTVAGVHGRRYRPRKAERHAKISCLVVAANAYGQGVAGSKSVRVR